ncbi:LacI family DNA-binding transcriptional regulator [Pseudovibrio exalbescens]|uniref:LacI family DNA-binding transcriptional regulator n=1 Tax=Pseudovibrio exalbescens TaxID=197461 RepID=UPI002365D4C2|nr:LacI family DNA-binding transcriptional regulator [Pseudovibrio exalbescens]MDD7910823.1 LacI family DNA-binding transcriptional regulator [Pseudovibrio exalbescens]
MAGSTTIKDVAQHAGVSVATVSRLLNGKGKGRVSTEVAAKVHAAVEALGYRPSAAGRSLKTRQTRNIGILIPSLSNPVFAEIFAGVNDHARREGYTLLATVSEYDRELELDGIQTFLNHQVDAAILTVTNPSQCEGLALLKAAKVPSVLVFNQENDATRDAMPLVTVDNEQVGRDVAKKLIALGHKSMAMIAGHFSASDRSRARRMGFERALTEAGLPNPRVCEVDFVSAEVASALDSLNVGSATGPTALFCSNDLLAIAVMKELRRRSVRVPGDVSVIGVDGIAIGSLMSPTLASITQPSREMGEKAAALVLSQLKGEACAATQLLAHDYQEGESVGPAATKSPPSSSDPLQPKA